MSLTEQQQKDLIEFRETWRQIGLSTEPADQPRAEAAIKEIYKLEGFAPPTFIWTPSIKAAAAQIQSITNSKPTDLWGQTDAYWIAYFLYAEKYLGVGDPNSKNHKKLQLWAEIAQSCCVWYPYDTTCWISDRPLEIHQNEAKQLHRDGGPAVVFRDGWALFRLNGVRVSKHIAETPGDKLDPKLILSERNAAVRAQIQIKIGWPRILRELKATVIDEETITYKQQTLVEPGIFSTVINFFAHVKETTFESHYRLLNLDLGDGQKRPFLEMANPSVEGEIAVEGVPPSTKTVRQALAYRNRTEDLPEILT